MKFNPKAPVTGDYVELIDNLARAALNHDIPEFERLSIEHEEYHQGAREWNARVMAADSRDNPLMTRQESIDKLRDDLAAAVAANPAAFGEPSKG